MRDTRRSIGGLRLARPSGSAPERAGRRGWIVAALGIALTACGDDLVGPETQLSLVAISGDRQPGRAGHDLPDRFLVRVVDGRGRGVRGVTVSWTVESGEGALDGRFEMPGCPPLGTAQTDTDADGFASVSFMPAWFGPSTVAATLAGEGDSRTTFTTDASDGGAVLTIVDGDHQPGKAGEALPEPLRVKVTDGNGDPVPNVSVEWANVPTRGTLLDVCPWTASWNHGITKVRTQSDGPSAGFAPMSFRPREFVVGTTTVSAAVPGVSASPARFTVETTTMVVPLVIGWRGQIYFRGPFITPVFTVPLGTTVEFRNDVPVTQIGLARIVSTATPPGGVAFDSGELTTGDRFAFVPQVPGTWLFLDQASGATGELTVR